MADADQPTALDVLKAFIGAVGGREAAAVRLGVSEGLLAYATARKQMPQSLRSALAIAIDMNVRDLETDQALASARSAKPDPPDESPSTSPASAIVGLPTVSRVRSLRDALGMTQEDLVTRSGGLLSQSMLSRAESGLVAPSSVRLRVGLAHALGVDRSVIDDYFEGMLLPEQLEDIFKEEQSVREANKLEATGKPIVVARRSLDDRRARSKDLLSTALGHAFNANEHSIDDIDVIRRISKEATTVEDVPDELLNGLAGVWLDAAASHRRRFRFDPSTADILTEVTRRLVELTTTHARVNAARARAAAADKKPPSR